MKSNSGFVIEVINWRRFQHFKNGERGLLWIKLYIDLEDDLAFTELSITERYLLTCIWRNAAQVINKSTTSIDQVSIKYATSIQHLNNKFVASFKQVHLKNLENKGFIKILDINCISKKYQLDITEKEKEKEEEKNTTTIDPRIETSEPPDETSNVVVVDFSTNQEIQKEPGYAVQESDSELAPEVKNILDNIQVLPEEEIKHKEDEMLEKQLRYYTRKINLLLFDNSIQDKPEAYRQQVKALIERAIRSGCEGRLAEFVTQVATKRVNNPSGYLLTALKEIAE